MSLCTTAHPDSPVVEAPVADSPSVVHLIRDHATALANALLVVRLAAGDDARLLSALEMADRQARALFALAGELRDPA